MTRSAGLLAVLVAATASAASIPVGGGITVDCQMSGGGACVQTGGNPASWSMTESAGQTTGPGMILLFNIGIPVAVYDLLLPEANGTPCPTSGYPLACIGDQVFTHGTEIDFYSAPNSNITTGFGFLACVEDPVAGCSFTFSLLNVSQGIQLNVDFSHVPNGSGATDTASVSTTPEPSSGSIIVLGLVLLPLARQWRAVRKYLRPED